MSDLRSDLEALIAARKGAGFVIFGGTRTDVAILPDELQAVLDRHPVEPSPWPDFRPGLEEALHRARTGAEGHRDRPGCTMCVVIDHALPGEARETLVAAAAGRLTGRALQRALRDIGLRVSLHVILTHRNEAHQP